MIIGYDAKRLFTNFTGLGNYSRGLVHHYHHVFADDELYLFTPSINVDQRTKPFLDNPAYRIIEPKGFKPLWRSHEVVKDIHHADINVYHGLSHELPLGISKLDIGKVVTIHDLIFKYYTDDHAWFDRKIYDWKWKHAVMTADMVIAISEKTKEDLVHYYNVHPEKIKVIYQSADPVFSKPVNNEMIDNARKKYNLPAHYNLYVGSVISRKNLLSIIRAMSLMNDTDKFPLVIIGHGKEYKKKVLKEAEELKVSHLLVWLGSPEFEDFPAIYKGAQMMIYPSLHEGFGLPVIEAMHIGIPVITSNQSSLKEAGGNAAFLIDPEKPDQLVDAIIQISTDTTLRSTMVQNGMDHIKKFEPGKLVSELRNEYMKLV
ncbi:MAG TPA: glycosyltransferase family 1 protein [Saprospiraceae bacterium]|nr:glycosyltransferase family 1 protein [Saprospiraceae bacterium]